MGGEDFVDQILTSLKVISMIKEGQKVRIRNGLLDLESQSTGICTAYRRWLHNDNRNNTLLYIRNIVGHAIDLMKLPTSYTDKLKEGLEDILNGLSALSVTYGNDMGTVASISIIQLRIRGEIE